MERVVGLSLAFQFSPHDELPSDIYIYRVLVTLFPSTRTLHHINEGVKITDNDRNGQL
jgi:hypothetical protein